MVVFATHAPKHRARQQRDHTGDRDKQAQMRRIGRKDRVEVLDSGDGDSHDAEQGKNSAKDFHVVPHLWRVSGVSVARRTGRTPPTSARTPDLSRESCVELEMMP